MLRLEKNREPQGFRKDNRGRNAGAEEWWFLPLLFPTVEQTFTEGSSEDSVGPVPCAADPEVNKTLPRLPRLHLESKMLPNGMSRAVADTGV